MRRAAGARQASLQPHRHLRAEQVERSPSASALLRNRARLEAGRALRDALRTFVTLSVEILPEIREYERTSTTVSTPWSDRRLKTYLTALIARCWTRLPGRR